MARLSDLSWPRAWGWACLMLGACFQVNSEFADCAVPCQSECPDGYACRGGACVAEGSAATCSEPVAEACPEDCGEACECRGGACVDRATGGACLSTASPTLNPPITTPASCMPACLEGCECVSGVCQLAGSGLPCALDAPIAVQVTSKALRAACNSLPYQAELTAAGGEAPYTWALGQSAGLELDAATGELSGSPLGAGERVLDVRVRDANGQSSQASIPLDVREHCWFAYVSRETGVERLHVVDVGLTTHKQFPSDDEEAGVLDFKFSPDGTYLAFRVGAEPAAAQLRLALADGTSDAAVPFDRPVLDYAWSDSGQSLAVILSSEQLDQHFLSGLDPRQPSQVWNRQAAIYRGDLQWAGGSNIVFRGQSVVEFGDPPMSFPIPDNQSPYVALADAGSIGALRQISDIIAAQWRLYAFANGFMARSLEYSRIDGYLLGNGSDPGGLSTFSYDSMAWSQGHQIIGRINPEQQLEVYSLRESTAPLAQSSEPCKQLLAWRSMADRERAVCLDPDVNGCPPEVQYSGSLRLYDFFPASNRLEEHLVDGCYQAAGADVNPRTLSKAGRWFVFDVGSMFNIAGLADASLRFNSIVANGMERAYAVSPDEGFLLIQIGDKLSLMDLTSGDSMPVDLTSAGRLTLPPEPCTAAFADEQDGWCGQGNLRNARWAPDAKSLVYQAQDGVLWIADVSVPGGPPEIRQLSASASCPNGCVLSYAYQAGP